MSKLVKCTLQQRKLSEKIQRVLDSWGVQHSTRRCLTPKYGDNAYELETWSNEDIADLIVAEAIRNKEKGSTIKYKGRDR